MRSIGVFVAVLALAATIGLHFTGFAEIRGDPESSDWTRLGIWKFESPTVEVTGGNWTDATVGGQKVQRAAQLVVVANVAFFGWAIVELVTAGKRGAANVALRACFGGLGLATMVAGMSAAWAGFLRAISDWPGSFEMRLAQPVAGFEIAAALLVGGYGVWRLSLLLRAWYMLTED